MRAALAFICATLALPTAVFCALPSLPENGEVQADAFRPIFSPEVLAIAQRFQAAVQAHRDWFLQYVKDQEQNLSPGDILPYHENFGVTKEEYRAFADAASHPKVEFFGRRMIKFSSEKDSTRIQIQGMPPLVGDLMVDRATQKLRCGLGASIPGKSMEVKSGGVLGPWKGVSFDYPLPEGKMVSHGRVSFGRDSEGNPFLFVDLHLYVLGDRNDVTAVYRWKKSDEPNPALVPTPGRGTSEGGAPPSGTAHF
jgi:hypothetical protein